MSARAAALAAYSAAIVFVGAVSTAMYGFAWGLAAGAFTAFVIPAVPLLSVAAAGRARGRGKHRAPSVRHSADAALSRVAEARRG